MTRKYASSAKYDWQQSIKPRIAPLTAAVTGALAAGSLQAATITVTTLNDGLITGQCSLRSALYAASSNGISNACPAGDVGEDTIVFAPGLNGTIQLVAGQPLDYGSDGSTLPIGDSVTINGDDRITVRGTGGGHVFYAKYDGTAGLNAEDVAFSNITITNGGGEDRGGGIYSRASYLALDNVTVSNSSANISGGGVHHRPFVTGQDKSLNIIGSTITGNFTINNAAAGGGGGVYTDLGGGGLVLISGTTFENNFATGGNGGGLNARINDYASMVVKYSEFDNNRAKYADGDGGGIFADLGYAQASFVGNTFYDNAANGDGGGLFLREDTIGAQEAIITVSDNEFTANQSGSSGGGAYISVEYGDDGTIADPVKSVTIENSTFELNESDGNAAGLRLNLGDTVTSTITGSEFSLNSSQSGSGGGVYVTAQDTQLYVYNTTVKYNATYAGPGGGMQISAPGSTFGMERSAFVGNDAQGGCGGGFRLSGDVEELGIGTSAFRNNTASTCGGGLSLAVPGLENSLAEFKYNEVSNNTAGTFGGGINTNLGSGTQLFLKNSTISGNEALGGRGGGARLQGNTTVEVKYSTIANNTSSDDGGGIYNSATTCRISDTIMAGNTGNATLYQDLRGSTLCDVSDSLIAGAKYSQFNNDGGNILNINPGLQPLANNGGPTQTHALLESSPAVDAGTAGTFVPDTDQRGEGFPRVVGGGLDMGAFELRPDRIFSDRFEQP